MIKRGSFSAARGKIHLEKKRVWLAAFIAVGYTLSLYLFFLYCRELFRYLTILNDYDHMMVLTALQNYYYNFFFAGLATLTGLSHAADFLLMNQFHLRGYIRYSITNDFSSLQWYSNYVLSKLGLLFGILGWSFESDKTFSLYAEYWFLFPMIIIVLFCNQWIKFRLFFKNSLRLMMGFALGFFLFLAMIAAIPFFDYKSFNHAVLKNTVSYNYSIELPHSEICMPIERWSLSQEVFIGYTRVTKKDSVDIVVKGNVSPLSEVAFSLWLKDSRQYIEEFEADQFTIILKADKNTSIYSIKNLIDQLREENIRNIRFMTSQRGGVALSLRPTFQELTNDTLYWHPSLLELEKDRRNTKTLKIRLEQNNIFANDSLISPTKLADKIKIFVEINKGNYLIDLDIDNLSSYQSFIQLLDGIYKSIFSAREEYARKEFSKGYDYKNSYDPLQDTLRRVYPINIWFLNERERAYLNQIQPK